MDRCPDKAIRALRQLDLDDLAGHTPNKEVAVSRVYWNQAKSAWKVLDQ